jgi:hypothetical protein
VTLRIKAHFQEITYSLWNENTQTVLLNILESLVKKVTQLRLTSVTGELGKVRSLRKAPSSGFIFEVCALSYGKSPLTQEPNLNFVNSFFIPHTQQLFLPILS